MKCSLRIAALAAFAMTVSALEAQQAAPAPSQPVFQGDSWKSWWKGWSRPLPTHDAARKATAVLHEIAPRNLKLLEPSDSNVCSIPLREVPVAKGVDRMPKLVPPAGEENIDHMPMVKLPAPPCSMEE